MKPILIFDLNHAKEFGLDEGAVGSVLDEKSKLIVGYRDGATWSTLTVGKLHPDIQIFSFVHPAFSDGDFLSFGVDLRCALLALGMGNDYEEEWGDMRGLVEAIRKDPERVDVIMKIEVHMGKKDLYDAIDLVNAQKGDL